VDDTPNAWYFIVAHKGKDPVYNVNVWFMDEDRLAAFRADSRQTDLLHESESAFSYPEVDPTEPQVPIHFIWKVLVPDHEHYTVRISERNGIFDQRLRYRESERSMGVCNEGNQPRQEEDCVGMQRPSLPCRR
jgi:hypothetical protein